MKKIIVIFITILVSVALYVINHIGLFKQTLEYNPHQLKCQYSSYLSQGPEDIKRYNQFLIVTKAQLLDLWELKGPQGTNNGLLFSINLNNDEIKEIQIFDFPSDIAFIPFGKYIYNNRLYVINQAYYKGGQSVEIFQIHKQEQEITLTYLQSVVFSNDFMGTFNNIIVLDYDNMVISKWLPYPDPPEGRLQVSLYNKLMTIIGIVFSRKATVSQHCNLLGVCKEIPETLSVMQNGITWNKKDLIFVSDLAGKCIKVIKVKKVNGSYVFTFQQDIKLDVHIDNIEYDEYSNQLLIAGFPKFIDHMQLVDHIQKEKKIKEDYKMWGYLGTIDANSFQVNDFSIQESGVGLSTFYKWKGKVYIGSWCDKAIQICTYQV